VSLANTRWALAKHRFGTGEGDPEKPSINPVENIDDKQIKRFNA
jgi:hypothetical protein